MLDPITALALTGNILQFIDFGFKATSKALDIYLSADGVTAENGDLEVLTTDIAAVTAKLAASSNNATGNDSLDDIRRRCTASANDLLTALRKLKVEGEKGKWKSVRKGLRAVWGKTKVDELRARLEGWRDEIQFHIVVQLRNDIDVDAIRKSDRFNVLDKYAKAILDATSAAEVSICDALDVDRKAADKRHEQTEAVVLATQSEVQTQIRDAIHIESRNSDTRHKHTERVVLVKQTEIQVEITQAFETLDSNLQAEQEATRRELEQLKTAMAQIEKDMAQRDEELKVLLIALTNSQSDKERKRLQERSNAVTIALYALVTVYESLQNMFAALQTQVKLMIASKTLRQLWETKITEPSYIQNGGDQTGIFKLFRSNTGKLKDDGYRIEDVEYLLRELRSPVWEALHPLIFNAEIYYQRRSINSLLTTVRSTGIIEFKDLYNLRFGCKPNSEPDDGLINLIIISTILEHSLGSVSSAVELMRGLNEGNQRGLPFHTSEEFTFLVSEWTKAGRIIGYRAKAELMLDLRCAKWGIEDLATARNAQGARRLYRWLFFALEAETFCFDVVSPDGDRGGGAVLFAIVEYFIYFGFRLTAPAMAMTQYGLRAHVSRDGLPLSMLPIEVSTNAEEPQSSKQTPPRTPFAKQDQKRGTYSRE